MSMQGASIENSLSYTQNVLASLLSNKTLKDGGIDRNLRCHLRNVSCPASHNNWEHRSCPCGELEHI